MRPNGLTGITLLLCAFNTVGLLFLNTMGEARSSIAVAIVFGYFVLFFFWDGHNWARILVLIDSFLTLFELLLLKFASPFQGAMIVADFIMAVFLIWWLNTSEVRNYFKNRGVS